jgi:IPT/TIG domain
MAQQFTRVLPGDLITANLMNRLFEELELLETRVAALEAGGVQGAGVIITELRPSNTRRIGEPLTVIGRNFLNPPENNEVTIEGTRVPNSFFHSDSSETQLVFDIPDIPNLSSLSQPLTLTVRNSHGSATAPLTVQARLIPPSGGLDANYVEAPVIPVPVGGTVGVIQPGGQYVFRFTVKAIVNQQINSQLKVTMAGWDPQILAETGDAALGSTIQTTFPAGNVSTAVEKSVRVRVTAPPGGSGQLKLEATETSGFGLVNPDTATVDLAVGQPPQIPEDRVRVSIRSVSTGTQTQIIGTKVQFKRGTAANPNQFMGSMEFGISFKINGRFDYLASIRNPTGWGFAGTTLQLTPPNDTVSGASNSTLINRTATAFLSAGPGATNTDLIITIRSRSDSTPPVDPPVNTTFVQAITVVD